MSSGVPSVTTCRSTERSSALGGSSDSGEAPWPQPDAGDDAVGGHEGGRGPLGTQQFPRLPEQSAHDLLGLGEVLTAA